MVPQIRSYVSYNYESTVPNARPTSIEIGITSDRQIGEFLYPPFVYEKEKPEKLFRLDLKQKPGIPVDKKKHLRHTKHI